MADVILYSDMDIFLLGMATVLSIITAILYFELAKSKENPTEKSIVNAYAWMFVFFTIGLILGYTSFFYIETKYVDHIHRGNFDNLSLITMWLYKGAAISYFASFIFYFYRYEKILNKRIHLGPFAGILFIILIIFLPYELAIYQFLPISFTIMYIYMFHTFFTLMKRSQRELRAATSFIIIGTWFMGVFMAYYTPAAMRLRDTPILIFPALLIFGTFLCMSPPVFKPEFFSRNIKYWYLFSIFLISINAINLIYYVTVSDLIELILVSLVFLIFYAIECVIFLRFIKREESLGVEGDIGVRGIFTKSEKITEEEVSISKEKKICLVCKGKVSGFETFLCPNCETFYCHKCARALIDLENACWACNAPIDKSKPIKLPEKEEKKVIVEEKNISKKGNKKQDNKL